MAVLHHHRLVTGQSERDAVLPPAVDGLQQQGQQAELVHPSSREVFLLDCSCIELNYIVLRKSVRCSYMNNCKIKGSYLNVAFESNNLNSGLIVI